MRLSLAALALLLCLPTALAKPPNIVLILSDDQSYTDYGFMGHPEIETAASRYAGSAKCLVSARLCPDPPSVAPPS